MRELIITILCFIITFLLGIQWSEDKLLPKLRKLQDKVDFYESRNHFKYVDTAEAIREADLNERW